MNDKSRGFTMGMTDAERSAKLRILAEAILAKHAGSAGEG
jgi:hypothetical protein